MAERNIGAQLGFHKTKFCHKLGELGNTCFFESKKSERESNECEVLPECEGKRDLWTLIDRMSSSSKALLRNWLHSGSFSHSHKHPDPRNSPARTKISR